MKACGSNSYKYSNELEVVYRPQVLVCGGGPAGLCAAVAAARGGAEVLLVEQNGFCGGMATAGLVAPFMTCYESSGNIQVIRGLFSELIGRMAERGGALLPENIPTASEFTSWIGPGHLHVTPFDAETLKLVADEMLAEAGVKALYHTSIVDAVRDEDGYVRTLVAARKQGLCAISPAYVIDCTGDADVAARAGFPFQLGDGGEPPKMQPVSMFFRVSGVDRNAMNAEIAANLDKFYRRDGVNYRSFHWLVEKARQAGDWTLNRVSIGIFRGVREDEWSVNTSRIMNIDGTVSESLSRAEAEGRRQADEIFKFLVKYVPGCENARMIATGSTVGVRETRHIRGLYTLRAEELIAGERPCDSVLLAANSVDVHGKFGPLSNQYIALGEGVCYGVPYRCLIPEGARNLLVAGRAISAEPDAAGAVRVMPPCMAMGQAAGCAAALAAARGCEVAELDVSLLRSTLVAAGVYLG